MKIKKFHYYIFLPKEDRKLLTAHKLLLDSRILSPSINNCSKFTNPTMPIHSFIHHLPLFVSIWFNSSIPLPNFRLNSTFTVENLEVGIRKSYKIKQHQYCGRRSRKVLAHLGISFLQLLLWFWYCSLSAFWRGLGLGFLKKGVALLVCWSWVMRNRLLPWRAEIESEIESFLFRSQSPPLTTHPPNLHRLPPRLIILAERYNLDSLCFECNWCFEFPRTL